VKMLFSAIVATAFAAAAFPALSQTTEVDPGMQNKSSQQNAPGTGGTSKPGTPGLPGSKSGPGESMTVGEGSATRSAGGLVSNAPGTGSNGSEITKQQDQSGVRGLPGSKSGPTVKSPSKR